MTLGVLLSIGETFAGLRQAGQESRFIKEYLTRYGQVFDRVRVFSYSHEEVRLPPGVLLVPNSTHLHRFLYTLLLPLLHWRAVRSCDVFRVMQATGGIPALLIHFIFRKPYVVTYGYEYARFAELEGHRARAWLLRLMLVPILKAASAVIVTTAERQAEVERLGIRRIVLVPNAVDLETFRPAPKNQSRDLQLLFVGRIERQKNLRPLLTALAASPLKDRIELVCIGSGSEVDAIRELAQRLQVRVRFLGTIAHHDLPAYYAAADAFVMPSLLEGHPKTLLEALASGLPCLVSSSVGQVVGLQAGQNALFTDLSAGDLPKKILELGQPELRRRLGAGARAFAEANIDIRTSLKKEVDLLKRYAQHHNQAS